MYPPSMFSDKTKKNVYPCKPKFYYIKGVYISWSCYPDELTIFWPQNTFDEYINMMRKNTGLHAYNYHPNEQRVS